MAKDIARLAVNEQGSDYIIADLHGNRGCLSSVIDRLKLKEHDRLFIAGDMVDRGEDSVGVIETILQSKANIQVIRGNHEEMTLNSIRALQLIAAELAKEGLSGAGIPKEKIKEKILEKMRGMLANPLVKSLENHITENNGGMWVVDLFAEEISEKKITANANGEVANSGDSKIKMVYDFMDNLPYIISVEGNDKIPPFNVVHADMPINDLELERRVRSGRGLSQEEKTYAVWARKEDYDPSIGRTDMSVLTYCGHRIIGLGDDECVRDATSMVDLDRASFHTNIALYVNHTSFSAGFISNMERVVDDQQLAGARSIAAEIHKYLVEKKYLHELRMIMKATVNEISGAKVEDVNNILNEGLRKINQVIMVNDEHMSITNFNVANFLLYSNGDPAIDSKAMRIFNEKYIAAYLENAREATKTPEQLQALRDYVADIVNIYNGCHQPQDELNVDALFNKAFPPQKKTHVEQQGLFAAKDKGGDSSRQELLREIDEQKHLFIKDKTDIYQDIDLTDVSMLDKMVEDASGLISSINSQIKVHNERYPEYNVTYLSCEGFYQDKEYDIYADLNRPQASYVKNSLAIEDVKHKLVLEAGKCKSEAELAEKARASYAKIGDIVSHHNIKHSPVIKLVSLASLQEVAEKAASKQDLVRAAKL